MNLYRPHLVRIVDAREEAPDTRTLRLEFQDPEVASSFRFSAGQFGEYSVFGAGECTFCIASPPTRQGYIECTFKAVGKVTRAMQELSVGDVMGFRGPYGTTFPMEQMEGGSVLFIAGGIGLAPVRCVIWNVLDLRERYRDVTILYGARSQADRIYKEELAAWEARGDCGVIQTVDPGGEGTGWTGKVGFVPAVLKEIKPSPDDAWVVLCGPPVMIRFTLGVLDELGFPPERILTTLENRMKCGLGKCGRCNIGAHYVCKDGPVLTAADLDQLPPEW